jgi:hypothetical protein
MRGCTSAEDQAAVAMGSNGANQAGYCGIVKNKYVGRIYLPRTLLELTKKSKRIRGTTSECPGPVMVKALGS